MPELNKIYLYRMVHIENVPHILQYGITHINSANANKSYKPIGDGSLINNRNSFRMPNGKTLGQYIPFYFWGRMPMLYVIQHGYNGVTTTMPENIVYCISSVQQIIDNELSFVFTDGHAVDCLTDFYSKNDVDKIDSILDKDAIKAKYWKKDSDLDFKRRKEAEFLVEGDIPTSAIVGWIVYNQSAKSKLEKMGVPADKISIKPEYYF